MLTTREREVLCLMAHSNRQTALALGISESRVKAHWSSIYGKFGIEGQRPGQGQRIRAFWVAYWLGIVDVGDIDPGPVRWV